MSEPHALPPPAILMNLIAGKFISHAIGAAAELGVADRMKDGPRTAKQLAEALGAHAPSMHRLLRALAMVGLFEEKEGGAFALTPVGEMLRTDRPGSLAAMARFMGAGWHSETWGGLAHSVKTGESAMRHLRNATAFEWLGAHPAEGEIFNAAMTSMSSVGAHAVVTAYDFTRFASIADVGGGHALVLSTILRAAPKARGVLFDLPQVVEGAKATLTKAEVIDRCEIIGGDFFKDAPSGCEAYVLKHIIHDWSDESSIAILKNVREKMAPNGRVLVVEQILTPPGVPSFAKLLDLEMLVMTEGGKERTPEEYAALFGAAGLKLERIVPTQSPLAIVEAVRA